MIRSRTATLLAGLAVTATALSGGAAGVLAQSPAAAAAPPSASGTPTGYTELDKALGADQPYEGQEGRSSRPSGSAARAQNFADAFAPFETATGIKVQVDSIGSSHETVLKTRIDGGAPPDLAVLAQPSGIVAYGDAGKLIDIATIMDAAKLKADSTTVGYYSSGDQIWAIPYKVDVKSVVWYPIKAFRRPGYEVPKTWDELIALEAKIVADGKGSPWCIGMGAGTATGWQATDWLEDVILRTAGSMSTTSGSATSSSSTRPRSTAAMAELAKAWFTPGYVYGGTTAIVATPQTQTMDPMFRPTGTGTASPQGAGCRSSRSGTAPTSSRISGTSGQPSKYTIGEDIGLFDFPSIDPQERPGRGGRRWADGPEGPARGPRGRAVPRDARRASRHG